MTTMLATNHFPNLLLYGPPGTGKTTTIINLVQAYQQKHGQTNQGLMIHLNASDERGIDIIRNQIYQFVNSKSLFNSGLGLKFVILDEVDYMTKNAQQALKYLLQGCQQTVRFCLICNYISRIDESLQNEFLRLRFNQLPKHEVVQFLDHINVQEELNLAQDKLETIQRLFKSDIRSMVNFMQSNQKSLHIQRVIDDKQWLYLLDASRKRLPRTIVKKLDEIATEYGLDVKTVIKEFISFLTRHPTQRQLITPALLNMTAFVLHMETTNQHYLKHYVAERFQELFQQGE